MVGLGVQFLPKSLPLLLYLSLLLLGRLVVVDDELFERFRQAVDFYFGLLKRVNFLVLWASPHLNYHAI